MSERNIIYAPITLIGESAISVFRVSGEGVFELLSDIISTSPNKYEKLNLNKFPPNSVHHCYIYDRAKIQAVDEVLITIFKSPNSYTAEDTVEISSHGGYYIFSKINDLLTESGISPAEPGEFTKRAFLNGKIDLAQAEAVAELIRAKSEESRKLAFSQLTGEYSTKIEALKDELVNYCSLLELELDFAEEGLEFISRHELIIRTDKLISELRKLAESQNIGKLITDGINLAIIGEPNVGKSSLFNYLLNQERAIVSKIPGTTRDYISEKITIGGQLINLIDTAGIRKTAEEIEQEGIKRSLSISKRADIVLILKDATYSSFTERPKKENHIIAYNKCDLVNSTLNSDEEVLLVSVKTGHNLDKLTSKIEQKIKMITDPARSSGIVVSSERHRDCLLKSCEYLERARNGIIEGKGNELISIDVREAVNALGEITGKITNVDILNNIFSKFCIGK